MSIIPDFDAVIHGGDYNPEQWLDTPEIIEEDFRLMDLAGCNAFSVGIFSWGKLEPAEGFFDFSWLDDIFDRAQNSGKKLFLATPSAAAPEWMASKYPDICIVGENGVRQKRLNRQNSCYSSPVFREKVRQTVSRLAEHFARHPALGGWHISNEYSAVCYCPECLDKFRNFLKQRYGSLAELNRAYWSSFWSHNFTDWSEIDPRDGACLINLKVDWKRFNTVLTAEFMQLETDAVRKFSSLPVTTNMMGIYAGLDYWKIAEKCDFIADDCYPLWYPGECEKTAADFSMVHDMHYAMKKRPFLMMESCPGTINYAPYVRMRRPGELQREMLLALGHGADGTMYFQWRKGLGNCEQYHGAVVGHDGTANSRTFRAVADYGQHLINLAETVDSIRDPQTAMILDWEARWALDAAAGFGFSAGKKMDLTLQEHYMSLWRNQLDIAVIDQSQELSGYKLVIAPLLFMLKKGTAEKLKNFVKSGGTLVMTYLSAYTDENNQCFYGGNPGGAELRELFGIWSEDIDGLTPKMHQSFQWQGQIVEVHDFAEYLHLDSAKSLADYTEDFFAGTPAITENKFGCGRAVYLGARTGVDFLTEFYGKLSQECQIVPIISGLPSGIHAAKRIGKNAEYYYLFNFNDTAQCVELPHPMTDLWNNCSNSLNHIVLQPAGSAVLKKCCENNKTL